MSAERLTAHLRRARLVALDVDGTLTDGKIVLIEPEEPLRPAEIQRFDVRDGIAMRWLLAAGVQVAWISGRGSAVTLARARELGVEHASIGVADKRAGLQRLQERLAIGVDETVAMGDDLPDLGLRARAAVFAAPADARDEIRAQADLVTRAAGGNGAVRELCEAILRAQDRWEALVRSYAR